MRVYTNDIKAVVSGNFEQNRLDCSGYLEALYTNISGKLIYVKCFAAYLSGGTMMKLTKEQKMYGARLAMSMILLADINEHKYGKLQMLCETFKLSNEKVVKKIKQHNRIILSIPSEQIYYDWLYVIYDESEYNENILNEFANLSKNIFPQIYESVKKIEDYFSRNDMLKCKDVIDKIDKQKVRIYYLLFYLLYSDIVTDIELIGLDYRNFIYTVRNILFASEKQQDEYLIEFNTGEQVIASPQFKKYLKARRTELAEYMSEIFDEEISEHNLGRCLDEMLSSKISENGVLVEFSLEGVIKTACRNILIEHGGGLDWYESITCRNRLQFISSLGYIPDVDGIIEKYYIQLLRYRYYQNEEFSKVYLIRECKSESPLIDLISIMFMYNIDVFTKMFMNLLEDYYKNFSWEKIVNQGLSARYDNIIASLKNDIQFMKNSLERANTKIQIFNDQLRKEKDSEIIPLEKAAFEFKKKIEEKDKEIEKLKQQLRSRDEFIELLENADDKDVSETIDVLTLQTKRYLFVGNIKETMPELRKKFSNSLFMENENFSLTNIKVDMIVMLVKYMSHGMYYKIKATSTLSNIPIVMCNTKNIDMVYAIMAKNVM